jgi:hypothetical protein
MTDAPSIDADFERALATLVQSEHALWACNPSEPGCVLCRIGVEFVEFRLLVDGDRWIGTRDDDVAAVQVLHRGTSSLVLAPNEMNPLLLDRLLAALEDADEFRRMLRDRARIAHAMLEAACTGT